MKWCVIVVGVLLLMSPVRAEGEASDVQAFLPLFEKNSLAGKVLDVSYSLTHEYNNEFGKMASVKRHVHLVFDAETGYYREEVKRYDDASDANVYTYYVNMWDGQKYVSWVRPVSSKPRFRALGAGDFEYPGHAEIHSQPRGIPASVSFFFDGSLCPFSKSVTEYNPKLGNPTEDTINIETESHKFEFAKKTGVLQRLDYYYYNPSKGNKMIVWKTYELASHVECSGVWMPLQIVETRRNPDGSVRTTTKIALDPETLRLLDVVEDKSIFKAALPVGCVVHDGIREKSYTVKTVGMVFMEAWEWVLEMARTGALRAARQGDEW